MIPAVRPEPVISRTSTAFNYRNRHATASLPRSSDSPSGPSETNDEVLAFDQTAPSTQPFEPAREDTSSMFAASLIAGALSPEPQTIEELMRRIGTGPIAEESEARLKDVLA